MAGTQQDVAFWCGGCDVVQEVVGEGFVERPCHLAAASSGRAGAVLYLPVWAFRVRSTCRWKNPEREALARHIPPVERVYVTGFRLHNAFYFGDPGLIFTEKRVILEPIPEVPSGMTVAGCGRDLEEAKAYVEPHLLTIIDRRVDVTDMQMECVISDPVLWGVPFVDGGADLRDGVIDFRIPAAAVEAIEEVRACQGKRRP